MIGQVGKILALGLVERPVHVITLMPHIVVGDRIASDERALVFSQYADMGLVLVDYLRNTLDREVLFLHGGTPMAERDRYVAEFQNDANGPPIFILSLKAGGTGLNLTRANHVFHFDRW